MRRLLWSATHPGPASDRIAAFGVLALRIHLGLTMTINAGLGKVVEFPAAPWFVEQVVEIGFPAAGAFAFIAAWGEVLGGLLLASGLFTRFAAAQLCIQMGVAAFLYHGVFPVVDLHITHVLFWTFGCLTLLGGGRYSLDAALHGRAQRSVADKGPFPSATARALALGACLGVFTVGCAGTAPPPSPPPSDGPFADLAGEWTGTLEYADFQDGSRSRLPISVTVTTSEDGTVGRFQFAAGEPSGRIERWSDEHRIDPALGIYQSDEIRYSLDRYQWNADTRRGSVRWLGEEEENGTRVPVRGQVTWEGDALTMLKETRDPFQFRNSLNLVRVGGLRPSPRRDRARRRGALV